MTMATMTMTSTTTARRRRRGMTMTITAATATTLCTYFGSSAWPVLCSAYWRTSWGNHCIYRLKGHPSMVEA